MSMYHSFFICGWTPRLMARPAYCDSAISRGMGNEGIFWQITYQFYSGNHIVLQDGCTHISNNSVQEPFFSLPLSTLQLQSFCFVCTDRSHYPLSVYSNFLSACFNLWTHVHKTYLEVFPFISIEQLKNTSISNSLYFCCINFESPFPDKSNDLSIQYTCFHKSAVQLSCYIDLLGSSLFQFDLTFVISSFIILSVIYSCFARYLRTSSGYVNSFFNVGI